MVDFLGSRNLFIITIFPGIPNCCTIFLQEGAAPKSGATILNFFKLKFLNEYVLKEVRWYLHLP